MLYFFCRNLPRRDPSLILQVVNTPLDISVKFPLDVRLLPLSLGSLSILKFSLFKFIEISFPSNLFDVVFRYAFLLKIVIVEIL